MLHNLNMLTNWPSNMKYLVLNVSWTSARFCICYAVYNIKIENCLMTIKNMYILAYYIFRDLCYTHWTKVTHLIVKDTESKNIIASEHVLKALAVGAAIVNYQCKYMILCIWLCRVFSTSQILFQVKIFYYLLKMQVS